MSDCDFNIYAFYLNISFFMVILIYNKYKQYYFKKTFDILKQDFDNVIFELKKTQNYNDIYF